MKKTSIAAAVAALMASVVLIACGGSSAEPFKVKLIGFNDYHGSLESPGSFGENTSVPTASRPAVGGAEFLAAHVASLKKQNPLNVVVGAGDFIGATPLVSSLFLDEPSIETLNRIGVEFNAVGNHEFDKGSAELLRLQNGGCKITNGQIDPNSCQGAKVGTPVPFEGARFKWLSANVVSTVTGKTLLPAYGIKTFNDTKVAFIGMTLKATPTIVTPTGVAGLEFREEAATVNALIPELKAQGIESIVVMVHEGGFQTGTLADINGCEGNLKDSAIASIISRLDDAVDVVISGHTHAAYNCRLPNAKGRSILVTSSSAFGRVLTDVDLTIDPQTRDITAAVATNRLVVRNDPAIAADTAVAKIVAAYKALVSPLANMVLGAITADLSNGRVDGACNMPAGNLIADSQLAATQPATFGGAVIAFMNGGGVRSPGFTFASSPATEGDGNVTYGEAFTVQPFGNSLVTMSLTTQNLKDFLEEQFAGCLGQSTTATRFALPSAGFKYTWDGAKACGSRIGNVTLRTGSTTTGINTGALFTGTTGNDTFNALDGLVGTTVTPTFSALDSIDGGAGIDTLNIIQSASFAQVPSATVKNIEIANITSAADVVVNTTAWTGLTNLNVVAAVATAASVTAAATTDVVASVGTMAATTATVNGGKAVTVTATGLTNLTAGTNAISVGETTAAAGAVIVNATGSLGANAETLGGITVVGGTSIAVTETLTATAALALATKTSNTTVNITGSNVVATGNASTTSVSVTQNAAVAAVASATVGVVGIANGTVTITDGNLATASDTIATVTLNYYGASTVASNVLSTVNVTGGATAATASGALQLNTTATDTSVVATTLALNSAGGSIGAITGSQAAKYTTVNVTSAAASTIADVTFAAATTLNFSGAGVTTLTALNAGNVKLTSITSTGAGVTIGAELAVGTAFTGGAGVDTISIGATTKAINMGAGNDVVTVSTTTMGAGGSVAGGDGIDTLVANTNTSAFSGLPQFTGFETLRVAGAAAQGAHNAVGFTALELGATAAAVSSFTNVAAGVGLTVLASTTGANTVTLADATGLTDVFNLTLKSAANLNASTNGITINGVETINMILPPKNGLHS